MADRSIVCKCQYIPLSLLILTLGCAPNEGGNALFDRCLTIGMEEQMEGMSESDRKSVRMGVEQGCKMIVEVCDQDPDGEMCANVKNKFRPSSE